MKSCFSLRTLFAMLLMSMNMLSMSFSTVLAAERAEVTKFALEASSEGDGVVVNADFYMLLGQQLDDVVNRGIPLFFVMELEVSRPRWYWRDVRVLDLKRTYRLSYNALTRSYRVAFGSYATSFPTLTDAVLSMLRIRGWKVAERDVLKRGDTYDAQIRLYLDLALMPKPFQINAITNRDWVLGTEWKSVQYSP
jgi:Domain of unknown function (DUF4390)